MMKRIKQREERLKKEKRELLKAAKESEKVIKASTAAFKKSFFEDLDDDDKSLNKKARRSGKLAMNSRNNVSYEIKNGQPVFHLRRSPRKCCLSDEKMEKVNRPSPKLFTPSGHQDYLTGSSPLRRRPRVVPSPIKFDSTASTEESLNDSNAHVQNIIA